VDADEAARAVEHLLELVVVPDGVGTSRNAVARWSSAAWIVTSISCLGHAGGRHAERLALLARHVAAGEDDRILLHIARADLDAQRHPAHLPIVELVARAHLVPVVQLDPNAGAP
jgi:hypothetical protein